MSEVFPKKMFISDVRGAQDCSNQCKARPKIDKLTRKNSLNKIVDAYICTDYIFFIPNLVTWLKTSILQNYVERLIFTLKSMLFTCSIYLFLFKVKPSAENVTSKDVSLLLRVFTSAERDDQRTTSRSTKDSKRSRLIKKLFIDKTARKTKATLNRLLLKIMVYFGIVFVYIQLVCILIALNSCEFPGGLIFLLSATVLISSLAFMVVYNPIVEKHKPVIRTNETTTVQYQLERSKKFELTDKTISKVKLF